MAYDDNSHGTHVAGIIAGNGIRSRGVYQGVAPEAGLVVMKVLDRKGNGNTRHIVQAIEDVIQKKEQYQIRILNISVGMLPSADLAERQQLLQAVEKAWQAGIVVVAAAGNNGPDPGTVTVPGSSKCVITVGSVDDEIRRGSYVRTGYSGRGPTEGCVVKPEILAPGTNIVSCSVRGNGYEAKSGTSMSAPVVSGILALLLQKYPQMTPAEVKLRLYEHAVACRGEAGKNSWGMLYLDRILA